MKVKRDVLEDHLREYEQEVVGLKSYIQELRDQAERHGTEKSEYEMDLIEAEHNVKFYEAEIARIKQELGSGRIPRAAKQGVGFFVSTAVGFIAGVFLGSQLKSGSKERREEDGGEG